MENDVVKLLEHVKQLYADKEKLAIALELQKIPKERSYRSESINEVAQALSKAQSEITMAGMNKSNPFYKSNYADLAAVVEAARPALSKNNLAVSQNLVYDDLGTLYLFTLLMHISGQWLESRIKIIPPKTDMHSLAGYNTYMKRIAFASLVGVVTGDEDDDGEEVMREQRKQFEKGTAINHQQKPPESLETLTKTEIEQLEDELDAYPELVEDIMKAYDVRTIADLPRSRFKFIITRVRERKLNRNTPTNLGKNNESSAS